MATEGVWLKDGGNTVAGVDFSNTGGLAGPSGSGQFLAVKLSTAADRTVLLAATQGLQIMGVLQNKPKLGQAADVVLAGVSKLFAGGTVTRGDKLMIDGSGRFITWTSGSGYAQVGQAYESAVVGQVFTGFVYPGPIVLT
jgi:hypothetical protein